MKKEVLLIAVAAFILVLQARSQTSGRFQPYDESLKQYAYPEWFRDAKFGIWSHWGPQAVPRQGDWYAKNMYMQGSGQNKYHIANYGPPSKFGYKDIIPLWKAEKWDPEKLMALYKKAGAKYFVSMGSHHDNFFLWHSKVHQWNSVNMGPHKDVVGLWQKAAKKEGLKFGVSEHLAASFNWFQPSHGADKTGPYAGIPYDGTDPKYADLYHQPNPDSSDIKKWITGNSAWQQEWLIDVNELIDLYHPDLLYSDSPLPFGDVGRTMVAHFYNDNIRHNSGKLTGVYTPKQPSEGKWAQDVERGVLDSISPFPWQTDTSIGDWFYKTGQKYKSADDIAQLLIDIISKNGNLLINVVQTPEGDLEPDVLTIVNKIGDWTTANGEGIYATRPWKIYGEGPSTVKTNQTKGRFGGLSDTRAYQATDIRFTTKDGNLYAFCMNTPAGEVRITSLGRNSKYLDKPIASVTLLGSKEKLKWVQEGDALVISKPESSPGWKVSGYKIAFK
ncbi:alpha-L-fucosidase [Mucilaginibacter boryungensis]|uniref:alpha-L-fucosidase n=1 Tax=Mucilaginibacter boryungensis TaxID=768480 RepID=A0ABR9XEL9_9SPHI|nr:alpha-L-fucosidase [Mucilaginibacter boryungensis]MBE9665828.1 alpha-L-fucosidase [Mucilaginibacter boryungensis]